MIEFAPFRLDLAEERLWNGARQLAIRRKPFAILAYLAANPKRLVTHEELLEKVWNGAVVSESSVRTHVHELRQALGEGVIETVIGRGYRFVAELAAVGPVPVVVAPAPRREVIGRATALAGLDAALARATTGHRQICIVSGDPGIGKTTVVDAFLDGLAGRSDVIAVRGHCIEQHGAPEPYLAVIEMLRALRQSHANRVVSALVRFAPTFATQIPQLVPDAQLEEARKRARPSEAVVVRELVELFEELATQQVVVAVIEDLQWTDVATLDLLALLGQRRGHGKLLVVATARRVAVNTPAHPIYPVVRTLVGRNGAIAVPLEQLPSDDVHRYFAARFPGHRLPPQLVDTVERVTGGVPLFLVSFVDDLIARGMLVGGQLAVTLDEVANHRPESVTQLIDLQLDRLTHAEQRALEVASFIGAEFATGLVAAALEMPLEEVDEICDGLARRGQFLRRAGIEHWPDGTEHTCYAVTHALVQEVCSARPAASRRARWHRAIAERLETAYTDRTHEVAHVLGAQFDAGQQPARALHYYVTAAERTSRRFASADAMRLYRAGLAVLRRLPETRERDAIELRILGGPTVGSNVISALGMASATLRTISTSDDANRLLERMVELARELDDQPQLCAALAYLSAHESIRANHRRAAELCDEIDRLEMTTTPTLDNHSGGSRAVSSFWSGDLARASGLLEVLSEFANDAKPSGRPTVLVSYLAALCWVTGRPDRAIIEGQRALAMAREIGDPFTIGSASSVLAEIAALRGDPSAEIRTVAAPVREMPGALTWDGHTSLILRWVDARHQPMTSADADQLIAELHARIEWFPMGATWLSLVAFDALHGHDDKALVLVEELLAFAEQRGERVVLPDLMRTRGVLLASREPAAATKFLEDAIALARAMGARMLELRATTDLVRHTGTDDARARLAELLATFTEGHATRDLVAARALLG